MFYTKRTLLYQVCQIFFVIFFYFIQVLFIILLKFLFLYFFFVSFTLLYLTCVLHCCEINNKQEGCREKKFIYKLLLLQGKQCSKKRKTKIQYPVFTCLLRFSCIANYVNRMLPIAT